MLQFNNIFIHAHQNLGQYEESNCYAMGWGTKRFGEKFHQQILRDVQLPIERNDKCEKFLQISLNDNGEYNLILGCMNPSTVQGICTFYTS